MTDDAVDMTDESGRQWTLTGRYRMALWRIDELVKRTDELEALVADIDAFCSAQKTIDGALFMDNYTDARLARAIQARIIEKWLARTAPKDEKR